MIMNLEKKYTTQSFYLHVVVGTHTKWVEGVVGEGGRYLTMIGYRVMSYNLQPITFDLHFISDPLVS
jgi:hypothetical protein